MHLLHRKRHASPIVTVPAIRGHLSKTWCIWLNLPLTQQFVLQKGLRSWTSWTLLNWSELHRLWADRHGCFGILLFKLSQKELPFADWSHPSLLGWRPSLVGWRQSRSIQIGHLFGWRPVFDAHLLCHWASRGVRSPQFQSVPISQSILVALSR